MTITNDTTGQLVLLLSGSYLTDAEIAIDNGHYDGTKEELNVRSLKIVDRFAGYGLGKMTPTIKMVSDREGYGCGWGETSNLYPITEDEAKKIRSEIKGLETAKKNKKIEAAKNEDQKIANLIAEAKKTGKPQVVRTWMTSECMNNSYDCSFDVATETIDENGKRKVTYNCCH